MNASRDRTGGHRQGHQSSSPSPSNRRFLHGMNVATTPDFPLLGTSRRSSLTHSNSIDSSSSSSRTSDDWSSVSTTQDAPEMAPDQLRDSKRVAVAVSPSSSLKQYTTRTRIPAIYTDDSSTASGLYLHFDNDSPPRLANPGTSAYHGYLDEQYRMSSLAAPSPGSARTSPTLWSSSNSLSRYSTPTPSPIQGSSPSSAGGLRSTLSDTTIHVAPSPPMPSSPFSPNSPTLTSRPSLINRAGNTSPSLLGGTQYHQHHRDASTTSSCLPSTSSTSYNTTRKRPSADLSVRQHSTDSSYPISPRQPPSQLLENSDNKSWRELPWKRKKRDSSDQPRHAMQAHNAAQSRSSLRKASRCLCCLAEAALGPFASLVLARDSASQHGSQNKAASARVSKQKSRTSRRQGHSSIFRATIAAYLIFSLYIFTHQLLSSAFIWRPIASQVSQGSFQADDEYSHWQKAHYRVVNAYRVAASAMGTAAARIRRSDVSAVAGDFAPEHPSTDSTDVNLLDSLPQVRRQWGDTAARRNPHMNPLQSFSNQYRLSKMFSKSDSHFHANIDIHLFQAEAIGSGGDVTACLYYNDAWISQLPEFMTRWSGPVSIVYESMGHKGSQASLASIAKLQKLRDTHPLIKAHADIHMVYNRDLDDVHARRLRERLILRPVGSNTQLNLARFFARTSMVWLVSDARILPSAGLRKKLNECEDVRSFTLDYADGIIIPIVGSTRRATPNATALPTLRSLKAQMRLDVEVEGVEEDAFDEIGSLYVSVHFSSLAMPLELWPTEKRGVLEVLSTDNATTGASLALFDRRWEAGQGPTNTSQWIKAPTLRQRSVPTEEQPSEEQDHDPAFYQVTDYDVHYAPSLVIGKDRQPWCTERFEYNRAACVYQMYLQGAKKWVFPDEWAYTVESIDKGAPKDTKSDAGKMKSSIASRLYTQYFSEACMHYGRAFLSNGLWDTERAQHVRYSCASVLQSYGIGLSAEEEQRQFAAEQKKKKKKKKHK